MNIRKKVLFASIILLFVLITISVCFYESFSYKNIITINNISHINSLPSIEKVSHKNDYPNNTKDIIGYIVINKINLKQQLYSLNSTYNDIEYSVQIHEASDFPNVIGGNFILEAHSGNNYNSFFRNLYKLKEKDEIIIEYNGYLYKYVLDHIYEIHKNGKATIHRDYSKSTITLITCTNNKLDRQTIYIGYLTKKECLG